MARLNLLGWQHAGTSYVPLRANLRSCNNIQLNRRDDIWNEGRALCGKTLEGEQCRSTLCSSPGGARSYGRAAGLQGVVLGGIMVRLDGTSPERSRTIPPVLEAVCPQSYFEADPGQSGPSSQQRAAVSDSVSHGCHSRRVCMGLNASQMQQAILDNNSGLRVDLCHDHFFAQNQFW